MIRPFDVSFEFFSGTDNSLELLVDCEQDFNVASPFSVPRLVEFFVKLGSYGGFVGINRSSFESSVAIESTKIIDNAGTWRITMNHCHPCVLQVLRNLLLFSHYHVAPLKWAVLRSSIVTQVDVPQSPLDSFNFLPFDNYFAIDSDQASLCISFYSAPKGLDVLRVNEVLTAWMYVAAAAGMTIDASEVQGPMFVAEEEPEWVADEVWLQFTNVQLENGAELMPLLNALHTIHTSIAPIHKVEIE